MSQQNITGTTKQKLSWQKFLKKLQSITNISADITARAFVNAKAKVLENNRAKIMVAYKCHGKTLQEQQSKNFHGKSF